MRFLVVACCAVQSAAQYTLPYDDGAYDGLDDLDSDPGYLIGDDDAIGQPTGYYSRSCFFAPPGTGVQFDLSGMQANDHDYTGTTTGGYVYRFNICGNTNKVCTDKAAPASKWRGTKCNNLGDADTMKVSLLDDKQPSKGVRFSYAQGDICKKQNEIGLTEMGSRSITFEVSCDASAAGQGTLREIQEISMCEYKVLFDSRFACPVASTRGSAWSMLLLCVLAVCAYCGIGYAYNRETKNKRQTRLLPPPPATALPLPWPDCLPRRRRCARVCMCVLAVVPNAMTLTLTLTSHLSLFTRARTRTRHPSASPSPFTLPCRLLSRAAGARGDPQPADVGGAADAREGGALLFARAVQGRHRDGAREASTRRVEHAHACTHT